LLGTNDWLRVRHNPTAIRPCHVVPSDPESIRHRICSKGFGQVFHVSCPRPDFSKTTMMPTAPWLTGSLRDAENAGGLAATPLKFEAHSPRIR
jgi:hypothetical protein